METIIESRRRMAAHHGRRKDGSVQQACMDSLFDGAKSEPTGEWTEMDLNGISRWQKQDDGAADIIWKSAD